MKHYIKTLALVLAVTGCTMCSWAQSESGYFNKGYAYGFQLNPAFANDGLLVSVPAIGNANVAMHGNYGVQDVLYNVDGRTTTFLNPKVSAGEFLDNIKDRNRLETSLKMGIISVGFKAFGGYNAVSLNMVTNMQTSIPKGLFSLAKEGLANRTYDISDLHIHADAYAELALNHSHKINDKLRVGGAFKFLVGGGNIDAAFERAQLTLGENNWTAVTQGRMRANVKGLTYKTKINDNTGHEYVSGVDVDGAGIGGFGAALDLGAVYTLNKDWTFSVAVVDLGFISWSNDVVASTNGVQTFETDRYTFNVSDDALNSFENEWHKMRDDVSALYELNDNGDRGSRARMLATTLRFGAEYTFPLYRKLTFGLLNTTRVQSHFSSTNFRLSANVAPCKVFSASINGNGGTYGFGFGGILNLHVPGFNLFVGMDHVLGKVAKQFVPLNSNAQVSFGMNIML